MDVSNGIPFLKGQDMRSEDVFERLRGLSQTELAATSRMMARMALQPRLCSLVPIEVQRLAAAMLQLPWAAPGLGDINSLSNRVLQELQVRLASRGRLIAGEQLHAAASRDNHCAKSADAVADTWSIDPVHTREIVGTGRNSLHRQ